MNRLLSKKKKLWSQHKKKTRLIMTLTMMMSVKNTWKFHETMMQLRHPNVIGIYAWFREPGQLLQMGWVFLFCFYLFRCRTSFI